MKTYVTRPAFDEAIDKLKLETQVEANTEDRVLSKHELIYRLQDSDAALTLLTDTIDREVLESSPRIKVIANCAVGYNNIDVEAATTLGVVVTNTPGVLTETTADFAWALLMAAARRVVVADKFTRAGRFTAWGPKMFLGHDVYGKTLGIIGLGRIGRAVARRGGGFGMKVIYHGGKNVDLAASHVALDELLRTADFISLHIPLTPATKHLLNDQTFAILKPTCIIVNTSRGPVIDEKALVRALNQQRIAAAGLDVYEQEPVIEPELLTMDNVVLAPHIASASHETRLKMCMMAVENLVSALKGNPPPNLVNPGVWDRRRS
jgi:glyoxylate reductase